MKKVILVLTIALFSTSALAGEYYYRPNNVTNNKAVGVGVGVAKAQSAAKSNSTSNANSFQGQNQHQSTQQGNSQTLTYEDELQAPAIGGPASGPCTGFSGGVSVPGFGFNAASVDGECNKREAARVAHMLGQRDIALKVLMSLDAVKAVMETPAVGGGADDGVPLFEDELVSIYD